MSPRIQRIKEAVETLHECTAVHNYSLPIHEEYNGLPVWDGIVEVFDLIGHPKAEECYAWEIPGPEPDYVAVLKLPPVSAPIIAVRAAILADARKRRASGA